MLDGDSLLKNKRGQTLKVMCILSWIWIGLMTVSLLAGLVGGPLTAEELEIEKVKVLEQITPEVIEMLGPEFVEENIMILEKSNELFYTISGLSLANFVLGFYGVYLMYNLKKKGFYYYLIYSVVPIISSLAFFGTGLMMTLGAVFLAFFSLIFCLIYGFQLKRMS